MFDSIMKTPESFCCDHDDYKLLACFSSMVITSEGELIMNDVFFRFIVIIILNVNFINYINYIYKYQIPFKFHSNSIQM